MLNNFEKKISDFILSNRLFVPGGNILLAVSGGADSTALLYALHSLKTKGFLNDVFFICAHINHQLRGNDAEKDEDFVVKQAQSLNIPIIKRKIDVRGYAKKKKLSIETAARNLRIEALVEVAKQNNCHIITTAHHKGDNAETIIQRLIRGTGFKGLGGIWPSRNFKDIVFVRPLLKVTRNEIIEYLEQNNLKWCLDKTNYDSKYRRNFIRHQLMPEIQKECTSPLNDFLYELSVHCLGFYLKICNRIDEIWPTIVTSQKNRLIINLNLLNIEPLPVQIEFIRKCLVTIGCGEADLTESHFKKILKLTKNHQSGSRIVLPGDFIVLYEYDKLVFEKNGQDSVRLSEESCRLQIPGQITFGKYFIEADVFNAGMLDFEKFKTDKNSFIEWFDLGKLTAPLEIRHRNEGDRFWPLGLADGKKVGKFLTDQKIPRRIRSKILIVTDAGKIIWLWPIRISEVVKITPSTRRILQLRITYTDSTEV